MRILFVGSLDMSCHRFIVKLRFTIALRLFTNVIYVKYVHAANGNNRQLWVFYYT